MIVRKMEAIERRLAKIMARDEASKKKFEPAYSFAKAALEAANEGDNNKAYEAMTRFNTLMQEYKLNSNV